MVFLYDELNRPFQTDRVLFVNSTPTVRQADVADGAIALGKENLTPADELARSGIAGVNIGEDLRLSFISFGFKHGLPAEADMVLDVRFLPKPFSLRELAGKVKEVMGEEAA